MKKLTFEVTWYGTVILAVAALMAGLGIISPPKDCEGRADNPEVVGWSWTEGQEVVKAAKLEVVTLKNCPPCMRLKAIVLIRMIAEGYDVTIVDSEDDTRGSVRYPSIYYLDQWGRVVYKDTGFKTYRHITRYLKHPDEEEK